MSFRRYEDDYDARGGNRWDRDRFERVRAKSRPRERESFRFEEDDRWGPRGSTRDIEIDERFNQRSPRGRFEERDRFFEEDRYGPDRRRFDVVEEDRYRTGKELAPYMNRYERELPPRPGIIRRRSSWDAFDRRALPDPRYDERDRERQNNDIKLNIRMGSPDNKEPPRSAKSTHDDRRRERFNDRFDDRRSHYDDRDRDRHIDIDERDGDRRINIDIDERRFDEPRYRDPYYYREPPRDYYEDYNGTRIIRERERVIDRRHESPPREIEPPREAESVHEEKFEEKEYKYEEKEDRPPGTKRGKTRMPKRLVHKKALLDLEYPFDEEDDFFIVRCALAKEQIDECIRISEAYRETDKITYTYEREKEDTKTIEAPPAPPAEPEAPQEEFEETVVRKVIENPTEEELEQFRANGEYEEIKREEDLEDDREAARSLHRSKSHGRSKSRRRRSKSRRRSHRDSSTYRYERVEYSDDESRGNGRTEVVLPSRRKNKERDINAEIRELEAERRALRHEREDKDRRRRLERHRDSSTSSSERDTSIRIEKDRRARHRSKSRGPTRRQLEVAAATLT